MKIIFLAIIVCGILAFSLVPNIPIASARNSSHVSVPSNCKSIDGLPDSKCTPGSTNLDVTQANIKNTICKPGYAKSVRPPLSYTEPLKKKLMKSYGFKDSLSKYELDHLIPLEIGGNPRDIKNLWPESHSGNPNSFEKDKFENYLHDQVCSGKISLEDAQKEMATDWFQYWKQIGMQ